MNARRWNTVKNALCAALIGSAMAGAAWADSSAVLPEARALIERHIEAVGGREALAAKSDTLLEGEFSMPAAGITGDLTIAARATGEYAVRIQLPGMGEMRTGYGPIAAWSIDPFVGPRLLEGEELDAMVERVTPGAVLRDPEFVTRATTLEQTVLGGQACYRVELEWRSGRRTQDCYAVDSGLLVAMLSREVSPMGEVESVSLLGEYRQFGKLLQPTVTRVQAMGQEQVLTTNSIATGPVDADWFELPAAIRTLLEDL
jgi:hypothetical protein